MFIVRSSMSRGAVRRAGTKLVFNHSTSFRPAEPRRRLTHANAINMGSEDRLRKFHLVICFSKTSSTALWLDSLRPDHRGAQQGRNQMIDVSNGSAAGCEAKSYQALKPRSIANTIAWARVQTPSLSNRFET